MVTGKSIGTLVVFVFSIGCVIYPIHIPIPRTRGKAIPLNLTTAPILAIAILWASQCLGPHQIRNGIVGTDGVKPYNILILFFSLAYMAITLDITGVLQAAAFWVSNKGGSNGWKLYFYFYVMLTLLSVVLGNDPVILSGTAFLYYYTAAAELESIPWLISEFAAANTASMVLFVGNPTNVVICEGFRINNAAFTAYTILPFIACNVVCLVALAVQFHKPKHLPRRLNVTADLDVRSALLDPRGALVGSVLLGTCLAVIIVVSFFKIDVWMISLPFAVFKLVVDFARDHYKFTQDVARRGKMRDESPETQDPSPVGALELSEVPQDSNVNMGSPPRRLMSIPIAEEPDGDASIPGMGPVFHEEPQQNSDTKARSPPRRLLGISMTDEPVVDTSLARTGSSSSEKVRRNSDSKVRSPPRRLMSIVVTDEPVVDTSISSPGEKSRQNSDTIVRSPPRRLLSIVMTDDPVIDTHIPRTGSNLRDPASPGQSHSPTSPLDSYFIAFRNHFHEHFPTFSTALPRLPFALVPFAFSQFILIEGLAHQGWIDVFAEWLVRASHRQIFPSIWLIGVLGVIMCNLAGTNIGATILLTKVVRAAQFPPSSARAAGIALAVASNIGAVSFTFSASLAGLLWRAILKQKGVHVKQRVFAFWNTLPLFVMTVAGLAVVCAEMAVLY